MGHLTVAAGGRKPGGGRDRPYGDKRGHRLWHPNLFESLVVTVMRNCR